MADEVREDEAPEAAGAPEADVTSAPGSGAPAEPDAVSADADAEGGRVEVDLEELQARAAKADEFLDLAQRTKADFENYRRRMTREVGAAEQRGVGRLLRELLPALDNLERALAAAEASPDGSEHHLAEGIRLVQSELVAGMGRAGVEGFSPQGEPFDPERHEAMAQQPVDGAEAGTVVEVYQQGYLLGETVIRPARVVVAA
jgi:molecular chaperone GrpE